jgi:hypothetical protein
MKQRPDVGIRWKVQCSAKCRAFARRGKQCGRMACRGGKVCYLHGGAVPATKAKAMQRLVEFALKKWAAEGADMKHLSPVRRAWLDNPH